MIEACVCAGMLFFVVRTNVDMHIFVHRRIRVYLCTHCDFGSNVHADHMCAARSKKSILCSLDSKVDEAEESVRELCLVNHAWMYTFTGHKTSNQITFVNVRDTLHQPMSQTQPVPPPPGGTAETWDCRDPVHGVRGVADSD